MKDTKILTDAGIDIAKALELFGDMATYDQMLEDFLVEAPNKLNDAKKFKEKADMANYAIIVHSLKSDCKYFGIFALADEFYQHELAGKSNDFYFVTNNFDNLYKNAEKYINLLKKYMGILVTENAKEETKTSVETILVVDDSNLIRNFIQKIFGDKYEVIIASDGEEAINLVNEVPKENLMCMFLDLNMPKVDGFEVLEYFKKNNLFKDIPVSIITGISDKNTVNRAFSYPIIDMLEKPFNEITIKNVANKTIAAKKK